MPRNRGRNAIGYVARSERNNKGGRKRSHGKRTGRVPNEAAGQRPRDPESDVDDPSVPCIYVGTAILGSPGPERAFTASDRSNSREPPQTVVVQEGRSTSRVEDPDSSDDSSDAETELSTSGSSASPMFPQPRPYDGRPNAAVFDKWKSDVEHWAEINKLSREEVMYCFPKLVTGRAKTCFQDHVVPILRSKKWEPKEVFAILQKECFPAEYRLRVHRQLTSATQGNLRVIEFVCKVLRLAEYLPYRVDKKFLATVIYAGLTLRIKTHLILDRIGMDGIERGSVDLETLIERALECDFHLRRAQYKSD